MRCIRLEWNSRAEQISLRSRIQLFTVAAFCNCILELCIVAATATDPDVLQFCSDMGLLLGGHLQVRHSQLSAGGFDLVNQFLVHYLHRIHLSTVSLSLLPQLPAVLFAVLLGFPDGLSKLLAQAVAPQGTGGL